MAIASLTNEKEESSVLAARAVSSFRVEEVAAKKCKQTLVRVRH